MPNEKILLKAKANQLGIDGYKQMTEDELRAAIQTAQGTTKGKTPTKGKTETNGASANGASVTKGKTKTSSAKGKGKSEPAKSTTRKTASKKSAAKGTAKRPTTATKPKNSAAKGKTATAKPKTTRRAKAVVGRANIDRSQIDWKAPSNVGLTGKRKDVMDALRRYKGNYDKCYDLLEPKCLAWYPNALNTYPTAPSKRHAAQLMLRWLIGRVAYDFVKTTEQHESGTRAAYGTSATDQDNRRRAVREEARKAREKAARAAKRGGGTSGRSKTRKPAGKRTAASKSKTKGR